ncbi:malate dehydrogenase [Plakobranchus ocellatus]|uniref:Malate dehydrogenase, cytoplasmic n=1 Tax=Plakobranchus ocellatus TaxID=259542 RepID=A0AAV4E3S4_9GAST|nr:malate dehydrogenase [Plakobranchus ocellatus]
MSSRVLKVVVTGASGETGLILSHMVSKGDVFGLDQWMDLVLVEHSAKLKQVKLGCLPEVMTCSPRLVRKYSCTSNMDEAFTDADVIFLASGTPPSHGLSRNDIIGTNALEYRKRYLVGTKALEYRVRSSYRPNFIIFENNYL